MFICARPLESACGPGPYRWCPVVRTPDGLAFGGIYVVRGADLTEAEVMELRTNKAIEIKELR